MRVRQLEVAKNLDEVDQSFDSLLAQEHPGFQIAPEVGLEVAKAHLETRTSAVLPGFCFNHVERLAPYYRRSPLHIDNFDPRVTKPDYAGIALHKTTQGNGKVMLRLVKPDHYIEDGVEGWIGNRDHFVGSKFVGQLAVGVMTVFSEGIHSDLLDHEVGSSAHKFSTNRLFWRSEPRRSYIRYTWNLRKTSPPK